MKFTGENKELKEIYLQCYEYSCEMVWETCEGSYEDWVSYGMYADDRFKGCISDFDDEIDIEALIEEIYDNELKEAINVVYKKYWDMEIKHNEELMKHGF